MNDADVQVVLDRLVPQGDGDAGDWSDVLRRSAAPLELVARRRRLPALPRLGLLAAAVAVAVAVVLTISAPWRGAPSVLERAAAAISPPAGNQVLYENIAIKWLAPNRTKGTTKLELWVGSSRFRVLNVHDGQTIDVGGTIGGTAGLSYKRAYDAFDPVAFPFAVARTSLNPASFVRSALASGRARNAGKTSIAGRQVIRIVLGAVGLAPSANYFVDARTYEPVRITVRAVAPNASPLSVPLADALELPYGYFPRMAKPEPHASYLFVYDFKSFRYLPSTAANRKLTDIRAAHPGAKIA